MPLYEYECDTNGHRFEVIRKFSDPPLETCPTCGSTVHKLASAPAFHLKGSGWYITDYAKKDSGGGKADADAAKGEKTDKSEKTEKTEKSDKADKTEKTSTSAESTTSTTTPAPSKSDK